MCLKITPVSPFSVLIISPPLVSCLRAESGIFLPASPEAPDTRFVALFKASTRQRRDWGTQDWERIWQCCQTQLQLSAEHPFPKQLWSQTTAPALGLRPPGGGGWGWSFAESLTLLRESTLRDSRLCFSGQEWWLTPVNSAGDWGKRIIACLSPAWAMYWVPGWPGLQNGTLSLTNTSSKSSFLDDSHRHHIEETKPAIMEKMWQNSEWYFQATLKILNSTRTMAFTALISFGGASLRGIFWIPYCVVDLFSL